MYCDLCNYTCKSDNIMKKNTMTKHQNINKCTLCGNMFEEKGIITNLTIMSATKTWLLGWNNSRVKWVWRWYFWCQSWWRNAWSTGQGNESRWLWLDIPLKSNPIFPMQPYHPSLIVDGVCCQDNILKWKQAERPVAFIMYYATICTMFWYWYLIKKEEIKKPSSVQMAENWLSCWLLNLDLGSPGSGRCQHTWSVLYL